MDYKNINIAVEVARLYVNSSYTVEKLEIEPELLRVILRSDPYKERLRKYGR